MRPFHEIQPTKATYQIEQKIAELDISTNSLVDDIPTELAINLIHAFVPDVSEHDPDWLQFIISNIAFRLITAEQGHFLSYLDICFGPDPEAAIPGSVPNDIPNVAVFVSWKFDHDKCLTRINEEHSDWQRVRLIMECRKCTAKDNKIRYKVIFYTTPPDTIEKIPTTTPNEKYYHGVRNIFGHQIAKDGARHTAKLLMSGDPLVELLGRVSSLFHQSLED